QVRGEAVIRQYRCPRGRPPSRSARRTRRRDRSVHACGVHPGSGRQDIARSSLGRNRGLKQGGPHAGPLSLSSDERQALFVLGQPGHVGGEPWLRRGGWAGLDWRDRHGGGGRLSPPSSIEVTSVMRPWSDRRTIARHNGTASVQERASAFWTGT